MRAKSTKAIEVRLILDEREAILLMGLVQNCPGNPDDEARECAEFRQELFNTLRSAVGPAF